MANLRSLWSSVSKINFFGARCTILQVRHKADIPEPDFVKAKPPVPTPKVGAAGIYDYDKWVNAWMKRDVKRRRAVEQYAPVRTRLIAIKRCTFLPKEITEIADRQMIEDIPRVSSTRQLTQRCAVTSRGRGNLPRWRLSRFVFRHMADYNKIAGLQRAMW
ncbi:28S ribosomal protein S14, mitochondrial [Cotesia glomerata]|uniref:28S ribosomal protein S14, mitochondrial n=1 Tax=Cotesia glomerata TaxID=32391 RepID=A0AAV7IMP8_COTGL|nr:28S ribosomal protein S14, mitochondrial [Cotesia glomerata]KAH0564332.1 hypothetical protein KQX54_011455 [Cotesia glomerata]